MSRDAAKIPGPPHPHLMVTTLLALHSCRSLRQGSRIPSLGPGCHWVGSGAAIWELGTGADGPRGGGEGAVEVA